MLQFKIWIGLNSFLGRKLRNLISCFFILSFASFARASSDCESFWECRDRFLALAPPLSMSSVRVDIQSLVHDPGTPDLSTSYLSLEPSQVQRVFIISSGVHGIEGFVGSRLQQDFLANIWPALRDQQTAVILIHAVNPWGFANSRRTTKQNVDLNRNFMLNPSDYKSANPEYSALQDLLNPRVAAKVGFVSGLEFVGEAIGKIWSHGLPSLRKSILIGQYEHDKGIFYGGTRAEPQVDMLRKAFSKTLHEMAVRANKPLKVFAIDLHTGYGKRGQLHLLADRSETEVLKSLDRIYGEQNIDTGKKQEFYDIKGGYLVWLGQLVRASISPKEFAAVTFELGTLDSQSLSGALDSLYRMQKENQSYFWGVQNSEDQTQIKDFFREMYNPSDLAWRNSARQAFQDRLKEAWLKF